ncbi:MAG TPA: aromatic ring-hydroxylating dioxygenase subunit alpha [Stellaceae bacterium]|jgi:anthranilate 1,2-dioxygenase large subunit|nr:aromatic ring-hydroxylating dioxygenase subunit alpha [Stellaceae bacterium]
MPNGLDLAWPNEGVTRVPYQLYQREDVYAEERARIFMGATWNYLCLEAEIEKPGDWRSTHVGDVPVVVARDMDGSLGAFENRCAHRGALICHKPCGNSARVSCVYHGWTYDLKGNLTAVTFQRGVNGEGGMPKDFKLADHKRKALMVESYAGMVFGTFDAATPSLEDYLGPEICTRIKRVMRKPIKLLGYTSQILPSNWKLYAENVKDPYHASLLHLFFTTFRLNRLSAEGGIIINESGAHHVSYSKAATDKVNKDYDKADLRVKHDGFRLADPSIIQGRDEFGDGITLQILAVFPCFIVQQIQNSLCVRQLIPRGLGETELLWTYFGFQDDDAELAELRIKQANLVGPGGYISMEDGAVGSFVQRGIVGAGRDSEVVEMGGHEWKSQTTRATESPLRGFWKTYREHMQL